MCGGVEQRLELPNFQLSGLKFQVSGEALAAKAFTAGEVGGACHDAAEPFHGIGEAGQALG